MKKPFISIVVPALNEEQNISQCINSIMRCNYPKNKFEVILVDNGSKDNTINLAKYFNIEVLVDKNKTIGGLRNLGCKTAKGSIYAFIDADCTVHGDWLLNAEKVLQDKTIGVTGSSLKVPENGNWIEKTWGIYLLSKNRDEGDVKYVNSGNCFIMIFNTPSACGGEVHFIIIDFNQIIQTQILFESLYFI